MERSVAARGGFRFQHGVSPAAIYHPRLSIIAPRVSGNPIALSPINATIWCERVQLRTSFLQPSQTGIGKMISPGWNAVPCGRRVDSCSSASWCLDLLWQFIAAWPITRQVSKASSSFPKIPRPNSPPTHSHRRFQWRLSRPVFKALSGSSRALSSLAKGFHQQASFHLTSWPFCEPREMHSSIHWACRNLTSNLPHQTEGSPAPIR